MTIEVFKTNVENGEQAKLLIERIHEYFPDYHANFDMEDCDRILRIKSITENVNINLMIEFLQKAGCKAEVLLDELI